MLELVCLCKEAILIVDEHNILMAYSVMCLILSILQNFYIFFVVKRLIMVATKILSHNLYPFSKYFSILLFFPKTINILKFLLIKCHICTLYTVTFETLKFILL
jgi:hypothetical protein